MADVIVYRLDAGPETGAVRVVHPSPEFSEALEELVAFVVPDGATWRIMDSANLPPRSERALWRLDARRNPPVYTPEE